jgi:hypothetical protein
MPSSVHSMEWSVQDSVAGRSHLHQRHSGAMQSIEPGISRFPDVQLHI